MLTVGVGEALGDGGNGCAGVEDAEGRGLAVGVVVVAGLATTTPLSQTSFFPLLTQVYFFPFAVAVDPTFLQTSPSLTAATAFNGTRISATTARAARGFFTGKG